MSSHIISTIFVIGGTGAQGMPVVRALVADKKYSVRVLTRDSTSPRAQALLALGNEAYAKASLKKYRPMAARNEDKKVFSGLL